MAAARNAATITATEGLRTLAVRATACTSLARSRPWGRVYPDFTPLAEVLRRRHGITSDEGLAVLLLRTYGICVLPASAFGEESRRLRLRVATSLLYGDTDAQRLAALNSADPCALPWIAASLDRLEQALADLTG